MQVVYIPLMLNLLPDIPLIHFWLVLGSLIRPVEQESATSQSVPFSPLTPQFHQHRGSLQQEGDKRRDIFLGGVINLRAGVRIHVWREGNFLCT